jgi:non-specific serine/threonine protein kinase
MLLANLKMNAMLVIGTQASDAFGDVLRRYRAAAGLSQRGLANRANLSLQAVSALENGRRRAPYRHTFERLADALELTPAERVELGNAAQREREREHPPGFAAATKRNNLPRQLTSFVGREELVADIASLVLHFPLVTVVGTGGIGKTCVAVHAGGRVLEQWRDGVWFVDLAAIGEPLLVPRAIAGVLRLRESPRRPLLTTIVSHLANKHTLLVLDNCEHLIEEASRTAAAILRSCPYVAILATSREALRVCGERVYRVPPLPAPPSRKPSANEALTYAAVILFVHRACASDASFRLTGDNAGAVADICRRLDGIPLAIELAAARIRVLTPRQIADQLDERFSLLTNGDRNALPRQRTMRALFDWSYDLLSPDERLLFARLAIFPGGFSHEAAATVCSRHGEQDAHILEPLSTLVDKSLVVADVVGDEVRYRLLESTREYALEKLGARDESDSLSRHHAIAYLALAEQFERRWYFTPDRAWIAQAELELDNWRAALKWCLGPHGDRAMAQRLAGALSPVWSALAGLEGQRWVKAAVATLGADAPAQIAAQLAICEAELYRVFGQHKESLGAAARALVLARSLSDPLAIVRAQLRAGGALAALGRASEGEPLLREALETATRLQNRRLTGVLLSELGTLRSRCDDLAGARTFYAQALTSLRSIGIERQTASVASNLAEVEFGAGNPARALKYGNDALAGHQALGNDRSAAHCLCNMTAYLIALRRYDEAVVRGMEALLIARSVQAETLTLWALQHLAAALALRPKGDPENATRDSRWAAELLGFVDSRVAELDLLRDYTEEDEYKRMIAALSASSAASALESCKATGAAWTEEQAVLEVRMILGSDSALPPRDNRALSLSP